MNEAWQVITFVYFMCGPAGSVNGDAFYGNTAVKPCVAYTFSPDCIAAAKREGGVCIVESKTANKQGRILQEGHP